MPIPADQSDTASIYIDFAGSGMTQEEAQEACDRLAVAFIDAAQLMGLTLSEEELDGLMSPVGCQCDGEDCPVVSESGRPESWKSVGNQDFCPECQTNGRMARALEKGPLPGGNVRVRAESEAHTLDVLVPANQVREAGAYLTSPRENSL